MATRFEMDKFDGKKDFALRKRKMKALLVQQKVARILKPNVEEVELIDQEKADVNEIACSIVTLYLSDNVLRRIGEIEDITKLWENLEEVYNTKSLTIKIYLKERYFGFKMESSKSPEENMDEFDKVCTDLSNVAEKIESENHAVILLNSLPDKYQEIKSAMNSLTRWLILKACESERLNVLNSL